MSAATILCAPTFADDTTEILNGQINLDASISVTVTGTTVEADTASLTAIGAANALTVDVITPHDVTSTQDFSGSVATSATTTATRIDGTALTTSSAMGNAASIIVDDGMDVLSTQTAQDGSDVSSEATLNVNSYAIRSVTTASASANAIETIAYGGANDLDLRQSSGANVTANANVNAQTAGLGWASTTLSAANGNSIAAQGFDASSQIMDVDQDNAGNVTATTRIDAGGTAVVGQAIASANGNAARIENENGYAHMQGEQDNSGEITADSEILVGNFDIDILTISSEGVGNSAVISNIGADAYMGLDQTNTGGVNARANFDGNEGGSALVSATAFGNAATTYICSECPVTAWGRTNQVNSATISSVVTGQMTTGGTLSGTATAIGNSATYQTVNPYTGEGG